MYFQNEISVLTCYDGTNKTSMTSAQCNISDGEAGTILVSQGEFQNINAQVNYTYDRDSSTTIALASSGTAVGAVSNDWLSLIVTIMVLSFILFMVIKSFAVGKR